MSNYKHGMYGTPTHRAWISMMQRVRGSIPSTVARYYDKGIGLDDPRWAKFENFYADMGECPPGMQLDRIKNAKGYSKKNCRWATRKEQARNRSSNLLITISGRTQTLVEWAEESGVDPTTIRYRMKHGWPECRWLTKKHG